MFRKLLLSTLAGTLSILVAVPAAAAAAPAYTGTALPGQILQQLLNAEHAAGMPGVFAEVRAGHQRWRGAAGVADVTTNRPVRPGMRQRVGSITKTFVATTVLQLVGERRVDLDAPASRYLPDLLPGGKLGRVTVRMLLNHTSGIGDYLSVLLRSPEDVEKYRTRTISPRELVALGLSAPPTNYPGAAWSYSNTNYILLGLLIERVTGRAYAAEVRRRILRPLGMTRSYFPGRDPRIRGSHARAYIRWTDDKLRDFSVYNMSVAWAAGELISTPHDLNVFFRALLSGRVLPPALLKQMQTTASVDPAKKPQATGPGGYGLGIALVALPCGLFWGHDGSVPGQDTISFHSSDGSRQVSLAENMNFEGSPGRIQEARLRFLTTALCGPETGVRKAGAAGRALPLQFTPALAVRRQRQRVVTA